MKPHEETWNAEVEEMAGYDCMSDACVIRRAGDAGRYGLRIADTGTEPDDIARAKLMAAAPDMARLLLEFYQWTDRACPSLDCNGPFDDGTHDATCGIRLALEKAGALPT